jgi:predicted nucleic acid-binding Zn ribbon protein
MSREDDVRRPASGAVGRAREEQRARAPRPVARAIDGLVAELAPTSLLGRVQTVWASATGASIAASASPVAEREGVLTVLCESSVWAHELEMLSAEVVDALNSALGFDGISRLRCRTA